MRIMITKTVTALAGTLGGGIARGSLVLWSLRPWKNRHDVAQTSFPEPDIDAQIQTAAEHWAAAQRQPQAAPLVANKLRLVHRLGNHRTNISLAPGMKDAKP
jgi:hypothetical protein